MHAAFHCSKQVGGALSGPTVAHKLIRMSPTLGGSAALRITTQLCSGVLTANCPAVVLVENREAWEEFKLYCETHGVSCGLNDE